MLPRCPGVVSLPVCRLPTTRGSRLLEARLAPLLGKDPLVFLGGAHLALCPAFLCQDGFWEFQSSWLPVGALGAGC